MAETTERRPGLVARVFFGKRPEDYQRFQIERSLQRLRALVEAPDRPLAREGRLPLPARARLVWLAIGGVIGFVILWLLR